MLARLGVPPPSGAGDREPITAVVRALYAAPPVRLADYAGLVFEADGDAAADRILDDAAAALTRTLAAVRSPAVSGPVVLGGGILGRAPRIAGRLAAASGAQRSIPSPTAPSASPSSPCATPGRTSTRPYSVPWRPHSPRCAEYLPRCVYLTDSARCGRRVVS
jgi:hypothetical protein